jgi:hypothetical protein
MNLEIGWRSNVLMIMVRFKLGLSGKKKINVRRVVMRVNTNVD